MHRILTLASAVVLALVVPIAGSGCSSSPNEIVDPAPAPGATDAAPVASSAEDLALPASAQTTALTGITTWISHLLPDGGQETLGNTARGTRIRIATPRHASHTAGSLGLTLYDDAGTETRGWITVIDGAVVAHQVPLAAASVIDRMTGDVEHAPTTYSWSDCNAARWALAVAVAAVVAAEAVVTITGESAIAACVSPAVLVPGACEAALGAAAAAVAALAAAAANQVNASNAVQTACDNLCTSDSWCTSRYGSDWHCNGEGSCERVTETLCFPCQNNVCGWDFTCVTPTNPAPTLCGCGGGGGDEPQCYEPECDSDCLGYGSCFDGICMCGT